MLVEGANVYILLCADGSYYTGLTRNEVETRVSEHNLGINAEYTSRRRPVKLVWSEHFERLTDAIAMERQLKGWSRAKKEALIRGDYSALPALAAWRKRSGAPCG
ncbi:GIY-YIG nuclease family protein [Methylocystis parvus]|uniref:GIY-YIG nuclease family protein n=1 Tax=Methylocystis parvus TaxID=134 RepID=UPI003C78E073